VEKLICLAVLDLFLAQPFGGRSLLPRFVDWRILLALLLIVRSMFTSSLNEEVKSLEEDIEAVKDKVDDPVICDKVRQFVYAHTEIQAIYKNDAGIVFQREPHISVDPSVGPRSREYTHSRSSSPFWGGANTLKCTDATCGPSASSA
jgi:Domain of unknown function in PX-proteins (DUF3818)